MGTTVVIIAEVYLPRLTTHLTVLHIGLDGSAGGIDTDVLAVEFKINLLAPARGEGFLACGRVLRPGRTLTVCQADVFTTGTAERILIATMLSTIMVRSMGSGGARPRGEQDAT